jgi:hypothetical protein
MRSYDCGIRESGALICLKVQLVEGIFQISLLQHSTLRLATYRLSELDFACRTTALHYQRVASSRANQDNFLRDIIMWGRLILQIAL